MTGKRLTSRIVGHEDVPPDQLLAHPLNFRRHPGDQLEALRGSMNELGWVKTVIVNRRTGHVIDGHARVEEALRQGLATVPVTYVDLDERQERLALAALDPISGMAQQDDAALALLLADLSTEEAGLQALLDDLAADIDAPGPGDGEGEGDGETKEKNFNITYTLVFESLEEQEAWFKFLAELKDRHPGIETISGRLVEFLRTHPVKE